MLIHRFPNTFQETESTVHTCIRPFQRLLWRGCKHRKQTNRIRAVFINQLLRINRVAFRLRHLRAVFQHHALRQQIRKRLIRFYKTFITQQFVEETRVQQMQNRMLNTAHILIDWQPIIRTLIQHRRIIIRTGITRVIPRRFKESIKSICFTACRRTALRTGALSKFVHFHQRRTRTIHRHIRWQLHRQIRLRHRLLATFITVNHWNRTTPITLTRQAPITQTVIRFLLT